MCLSIKSSTNIEEILSRYMIDRKRVKLEEHIGRFIDSAITRDDYSFSTGLLGAGWLLSFFYQHEVLDGDMDDVLSDFDDNLYKLAIKAIVEPNSAFDDLLNFTHYFQQRVQNKPTKHSFCRRFVLFETVKLLSTKIISRLTNGQLNKFEEIRAILQLSYLVKSCLHEREIEEVFYSKTEELIEDFRQLELLSRNDHYYLRLLQLSSVQYGNPFWVSEIENIFNKTDKQLDTHLTIKLKKLNRMLFDDPDYKLILSNYNSPNTINFMLFLSKVIYRLTL